MKKSAAKRFAGCRCHLIRPLPSLTRGLLTYTFETWHYCFACFLPNTSHAIGIVLTSPARKSDQPTALRLSLLSLSAKSKPAPKPMAPRVAAIRASSHKGIVLSSVISIAQPPNPGRLVSKRNAIRSPTSYLLVPAADADRVGSDTSLTISPATSFLV